VLPKSFEGHEVDRGRVRYQRGAVLRVNQTGAYGNEGMPIMKMWIHGLRHSYATIRLLKGHNIGDVSYQLGHASIKITFDVYGHWVPGSFKSQVDELDKKNEEVQGNNKKVKIGE
jgi:integrase